MISTGWKSPGTITVVDRDSKPGTWSNQNGALLKSENPSAAVGNRADTTISGAANYGDWLQASNFGFALPIGVTVVGIEMRVRRWQSANNLKDSAIRLVDESGTIGSTDRSKTEKWTTTLGTMGYTVYGSSSDLWGDTWTEANIEDTDFGCAISVQNTVATGTVAYVDHIQMRVWYTEDSVWNRRCKLTLKSDYIGAGVHNNIVFQISNQDFPDEAVTLGGSNAMASDGRDIRISTDISGSNMLPYVIERCELNATPANSRVSLFVLIPSVPSGADFDLYLWYNSSTATAPTFTLDVFDNWEVVHLMKDAVPGSGFVNVNLGTMTLYDASPNGHTATITCRGTPGASSFAREDSASYPGGYRYKLVATTGDICYNANYVTGTFAGLTFSNGQSNFQPARTNIFTGQVVDNIANRWFSLCPSARVQVDAEYGFFCGWYNNTDLPVNPLGPGTQVSANIISVGSIEGGSYNGHLSATIPTSTNEMFFGVHSSAMALYGNGAILDGAEGFYCKFGDTGGTKDTDYWLWAEVSSWQGGFYGYTDFCGIMYGAVNLAFHQTMYNQWMNKTNSMTVGAPGGTGIPVTMSVTDLSIGDRVGVYRTISGYIHDYVMYSTTSGINNIGGGTFTISGVVSTVPADTPASGWLICVARDTSGKVLQETKYRYASYTGAVFTLCSGITLSRAYTPKDSCYVPYIEGVCIAGTTVTSDVVYATDRAILTRWRRKGYLPFEIPGTLTSAGYSTSVLRIADSIVT